MYQGVVDGVILNVGAIENPGWGHSKCMCCWGGGLISFGKWVLNGSGNSKSGGVCPNIRLPFIVNGTVFP